MKRTAIITSTLLCSGLLLGAVGATPSLVNAATYYETTTNVDNPQNGDLWYRNVGDGTDMLNYQNGVWTLSSSNSARRQAASDAANKSRQAALDLQQSYIGQAEANPEQYTHMLSTQTETILVIDGKTPQPYLTIPKVDIPEMTTASSFVSDTVPVMLPVIESTTNTSTTTETSPSKSDTSTNTSTPTDDNTTTSETTTSTPTDTANSIGKIDAGDINTNIANDLSSEDNGKTADKSSDDTTTNSEKAASQQEKTPSNTVSKSTSTTSSKQNASSTSTPTTTAKHSSSQSSKDANATSTTTPSATSSSQKKTADTKKDSKSSDAALPQSGEGTNSLTTIGLTITIFMGAVIAAVKRQRA